jgi:hypothetical protein
MTSRARCARPAHVETRKPQVKNRSRARICARDAPRRIGIGETQHPGREYVPPIRRGQRDDERPPRASETGVVRLITQRRQLTWLSGHDHGKYAVKWRSTAEAGLAFGQVEPALDIRQHIGLIIHRSWVRAPPTHRPRPLHGHGSASPTVGPNRVGEIGPRPRRRAFQTAFCVQYAFRCAGRAASVLVTRWSECPMVRRRSTVRFRNGAPQVKGRFRSWNRPFYTVVQQQSAAVVSGSEPLTEFRWRLAGRGRDDLGVDLHRDGDLAVPQDLHGDTRMDIECCQQGPA